MPSKRNKTIRVTANDFDGTDFVKLTKKTKRMDDQIFHDDFIEIAPLIVNQSVDLIVADPPYTIHRNFGRGTISTKESSYTAWSDKWITECARILKPTGSIYVCINWEASSIIESALKKHFIIQNRITWKRDKGRGAKQNWKNNMEDIWFATKSNNYTFNLDDVKVKKPVIAPYVDASGKPKDWQEINGERFRYTHPSNIWTDLTVPFWSMAENTEHPTQKPEKLIERIILASSNENDLILDPFLGSGTTAVVARKLKRKFIGFEIEKRFYALAAKRLQTIKNK